jgi:hypothetical protein
MALIYSGTKPIKKPKRKPGWQEVERQHAEWLAKWKKPGDGKKPSFKPLQAPKLVIDPSRSTRNIPSVHTSPPQREVPIHDPRVLYKENPELAERELKARERRFITAPVYNKGGDVLITDEMLKDIMSGATRRRN